MSKFKAEGEQINNILRDLERKRTRIGSELPEGTNTPLEIVPGELQVLELSKENIEVMNSLWDSNVGNPQWYWKNSC